MMTTDDLVAALAKSVDDTLAKQLIEEAVSIEEAFLLKRWKYTELDGGRFAEVAARIVYSIDSGNVALTKGVDDCFRYIDNQQVTHQFPDFQAAVHLTKVIRSIYKLRSQRGAVHVSPTYTANEIDSRLIVESVRWVLAEILRLFVNSNRDELVDIIRGLSRFPWPLMRNFGGRPLLQAVSFTTEEEILAHLVYAQRDLSTVELISAIPKDPSSVRRSLKKLADPKVRQVLDVAGRWHITDIGIARAEERIERETNLKSK